MSELVDCRGLSCPEPVLLARQAIEREADDTLTVIVSNAVARDNVTRTARAMGRQVKVEEEGEDFKLQISK